MRKWMRERLKGRKKDPAKIEEKPVPLQPAYFEADATASPASPDQPEAAPPRETQRGQIQEQEPQTKEPSTPSKAADPRRRRGRQMEEHTSELQSPCNLVCRLLLEKKKKTIQPIDVLETSRTEPD